MLSNKHSLVSLKMRRLFLVTLPSLVVLGVLTLSGWRWWRNRAKKCTRRTSVESATSLPSEQPSPSISEDSGVVDGAQVSEKNSEECLATVVANKQSRTSKESSSKGRWKYPTASSDVDCESMSEVGSMCSSEEVFSESASYMSGVTKRKKIGASLSVPSVLVEPEPSSGDVMQKSVSTPNINAISWPNRKRVMVQLPRDLVGRFIGKQGRNIKSLMSEADGAHVYVNQKNLPKDALIVPCTVQGTCEQVEKALKIIVIRYPELDLPSQLEKSMNLQLPFPSPLFGTPRMNGDCWKTTLAGAQIPSSPFKAMVTYIESLSRLWIVPYDKSAELDDQHQSMSYTYCYAAATGNDTTYAAENDEGLLKKFCAVRVSDIHWLRGQIAKLHEEGGNYEVLLVDYGSTVIVPHTAVRPLRREHTVLPIQAFPCELANVIPNDALSEDGLVSLQTLVEGMVLEVHITQTPTPPLTPGRDLPVCKSTSLSSKNASLSSKNASPSSKDVSPSSKDVSPNSKDVSPSSKDASLSSKDVSLSSNNASPSSKDASPGSKDISPSKKESNAVLQWFHMSPAPLVELYARYGSNTPLFINRELVDRGYAAWKDNPRVSES